MSDELDRYLEARMQEADERFLPEMLKERRLHGISTGPGVPGVEWWKEPKPEGPRLTLGVLNAYFQYRNQDQPALEIPPSAEAGYCINFDDWSRDKIEHPWPDQGPLAVSQAIVQMSRPASPYVMPDVAVLIYPESDWTTYAIAERLCFVEYRGGRFATMAWTPMDAISDVMEAVNPEITHSATITSGTSD